MLELVQLILHLGHFVGDVGKGPIDVIIILILSPFSTAHIRFVALRAQDGLRDLSLVAHLSEVRELLAGGSFSVGPDRFILVSILKSDAIGHFLVQSVLASRCVVDLVVGLREMVSLAPVTTLGLLCTLLMLGDDADCSREASEVGVGLYVCLRELRNGHDSRLLPRPPLIGRRILLTYVLLLLILLLRIHGRLDARILLQNRVLVVRRVQVVVVA